MMKKTPAKYPFYPHTGLPCHLTIDDTCRPTTIGDTLQAIQQLLTRIERNETTPRSYAAAATGQGRDEPAPLKN